MQEGCGYMNSNSAAGGGDALLQKIRTVGEVPIRAIGAVNALAAHVAQEQGFDALWVSGLEVSAAAGLPDANVVGVHEIMDVIYSLHRSSNLPTIVDIDNGGGSTQATERYASDLANIGVAAICLEDSAYPKCNSFSLHAKQRLADDQLLHSQIKRSREILAGRALLIARTETLICGGSVRTAIGRAESYLQAGADIALIHSKDRTGKQALEVAAGWTAGAPLAVIPTAFPHLTAGDLASSGYGIVIYANQLSRAALAAMRAVAKEIEESGTFPEDRLPPVGDLLRVGDPSARSCI
jgi:phosphoenolpyruvate phosphomutase